MTRVLSYNILVGGTRRVHQIDRMISSARPDIVGLVEATNPRVVEELAQRLEMQPVMSGTAEHPKNRQIAVLTRLPIVSTQVHIRPRILSRPVLEVCVEEPNGQQLTVFVTHLSAAFNNGRAGEHIRRREVQELLRIMSTRQGTPHLLMGDFNALAPGDPFKAHFLLQYLVDLDRRYKANPMSIDGLPHLNFVVPPQLRIFNPLLRIIPRSRLLSTLFDGAASVYAPRGSIALLRGAGYVDSYRNMHPARWGFTCPAIAPAGRIDYIFASPELGQRLLECDVLTGADGLSGSAASDHLPVLAEYSPVRTLTLPEQQQHVAQTV